MAINSVAGHAVLPSLGFGGVGASGMGRHHGQDGFRELSNPRGYFERRNGDIFDLIDPAIRQGNRDLIDEVAYGPIRDQLKFAATTIPRNLVARFR